MTALPLLQPQGGDPISIALERLERATARLSQLSWQTHLAEMRHSIARDSLEDAVAKLYGAGAITGKNSEERSACLRRLTAAQVYEAREAEFEAKSRRAHLEQARLEHETARYALRAITASLEARS